MTAQGKPEYEEVQAAAKKLIHLTINGGKLTIAPTPAAKVLQAFGKRVGNNSEYNYGWVPINADYQLHLGGQYDKEDVCKAAGMKVFDVAVPHDWQSQPENMRKWKSGEWAVWSYDGSNRTFGAPVWRTQVFQMLKKNVIVALRKKR